MAETFPQAPPQSNEQLFDQEQQRNIPPAELQGNERNWAAEADQFGSFADDQAHHPELRLAAQARQEAIYAMPGVLPQERAAVDIVATTVHNRKEHDPRLASMLHERFANNSPRHKQAHEDKTANLPGAQEMSPYDRSITAALMEVADEAIEADDILAPEHVQSMEPIALGLKVTPEPVADVVSHIEAQLYAQEPKLITPVAQPQDPWETMRAYENTKPETSEFRDNTRTQLKDEATYDIASVVLGPDAHVSANDINEQLEREHVVKRAPDFKTMVSQAAERGNLLVGNEDDNGISETLTEGAALEQLADFLTIPRELTPLMSEAISDAEELLENLTFIGEKEYVEAAEGIAIYWKTILNGDQNAKLFLLTGKLAQTKAKVKSDTILLDTILGHFSDEELTDYGDRLSDDETKLSEDPTNTRVVLVDDWSISGQQIKSKANRFLNLHPNYGKGQVEVQLIVSDTEKLTHGLNLENEYDDFGRSGTVPVRAYYLAHDSPRDKSTSGAHITGFNSNVDYDFNSSIASLKTSFEEQSKVDTSFVPPKQPILADLSRQNRNRPMHNIERLRQAA